MRRLEFEACATRWNSPGGEARSGGDWCEIVTVTDDLLALTVGDVCGHGDAASSTMQFLLAAIIKAIRVSRAPSEIMEVANCLVCALDCGVIVTAVVAFLDRRRRTFSFANAGHPAPLLVTSGGHLYLSKAAGDLPLGIFPLYHSAEHVVALPDDALITLYTDGITEHRRDLIAGESELTDACRRAFAAKESDAASEIARHVFRTGRGTDDAAVLAVRATHERAPSRWGRLAMLSSRLPRNSVVRKEVYDVVSPF